MATYSITDLDNRLAPSALMPVLFVGHGSPMNAISDNAYTRTWHQLGQELPQAQAIVVVSAHWLTPGQTHITDAPKNPIIYDFGGFPAELSRVRYESVGDTDVARLLARQLVEYEAELDKQWGLDHGTWSVLKHLAPAPEVPVLQISIDYTMPLPQLYELYGRLRAMRRRGVVFIGSGNIVHALGRVKWDGGAAWDWAEQFDADTAVALQERQLGKLLNPYGTWAEARIAVPTDDHYRPMVAALSLLEDDEDIRFFNDTIDHGSIGMRSFVTV
ncbi:dioxygenase family protein [Aeromicrobium wangtongii]|uniref:Dioxygenase n=1 Tax=Aeromicrobium wangtongii TaxID=2969247 RepID=A0ABY5M5P2_9ACTN|nr:class III extradiol ring-cleavage dioxygenase [Aeromicrobium wangtongii]MCD9198286.1 dioxygenase [Aeromicrobium wangtongii]UUP12318.1 dioxygenase [Aeromicrobium wangtongii]